MNKNAVCDFAHISYSLKCCSKSLFFYYIFFNNEEILKNLYIVPPNNLAFFKLSSEVIFLYMPSSHSKPAWLCSVEHKIRYFKNCLVTES